MNRALLAVAMMVVLTFSCCFGANDLEFARAIYSRWNYSKDASVGLDADYDNNRWIKWKRERVLGNFKTNSLFAAENNMTYVAGLYYLIDPPEFEYHRAVNRFGQEQEHVPSPIDGDYWRKVIEEPAIAVANLSLSYPIWGLVFDFELYLRQEGWDLEYYSFDDLAMGRFANYTETEIPKLDPDDRYGWLNENGLLDDFMACQEEVVYMMARETRDKVHGINPNLSLGILGFADYWRYWTTMRGFSGNLTTTIWTEDTYYGYEESRVEYLRNTSRMLGLNCRVIPGLYTVALEPWTLLQDMERATRHNGVFWIYQQNGDPFHLADEETYSRVYDVFNRYIFFNRSRARPLPPFHLYPGVVAHPYSGPDEISILIKPQSGLDLEKSLSLVGGDEMVYVGTNLSLSNLSSSEIAGSDLPCILSGVGETDLLATEALSLIRELRALLEGYEVLGLGETGELESILMEAVADYGQNRYGEVKTRLGPLSDKGYLQLREVVVPVIQEAKSNPRDSDVPFESIRDISYASELYRTGKVQQGNAHLIRGIRQWSLTVPELHFLALSSLFVAGFVFKYVVA